MAINFNNQNRGIGTLDLGDFGLQQPEENMTVAEAINYGTLPQAQNTFTPEFPMGAKMNLGVKKFMKNNPTPTKTSFIEALERGDFGGATGGMFDKNVGTLFEGVPLDASLFSTEVGDVNPQFISPKGSFGGTIDIRKDQLSNPEDLPAGFFKGVGDQSSLGLPTNDRLAMAISNYDQLFGPRTMTDANQSLYTGVMDQSGNPIMDDIDMQYTDESFNVQPKESLRNIIGSQLQNAKTNIGQKVGQGMDFMGGIKDYIMGGGMLGMATKGIGGLLSNIFQESPEQTYFKENIATDPEYQNLVSQIPGMSKYNQIYAMGSGRGLMGAADRRLATINKTLGRMTPQQLAQTSLKKRKAKLEALREIERQGEMAGQKQREAATAARARERNPNVYANAGVGSGGFASQNTGTNSNFSNRTGRGRTGYSEGGLASMFTRRG